MVETEKIGKFDLLFKREGDRMILETQRLRIRPIELADMHAVFDYRSDTEANKYQSWIPQTLQEVADFIAKNPENFNQPDSWFQLVIIDQSTQSVVGDIGIHFIDAANKLVEFGITLSGDVQGKGYATEALNAVFDALFLQLDKHRISASIDPDNVDSIKLMERLGLRKEAHFKESLWWNGRWVDDIIYAMLAKER